MDITARDLRLPHSRRRWFRYSLRTLLCVVALICVWLGIISARARRQRRAHETLSRHGAEAYAVYDFEYVDEGANPSPPPGPDWLRKIVGLDYFATVVQVQAVNLGDDISVLGELPNLRTLHICGEHLSDREIVYLRLSPQMRHLMILVARPGVSDSGWQPLEALTGLKELTVGGSGITDSTLQHIASLGNLESLRITEMLGYPPTGVTYPAVTDAGLASMMSRLTNLRSLELRGVPKFGDDSLCALAKYMSRIEHLNLGGTGITDQGLEHLEQLTSSRWLDLEYTSVTDAGLAHLRGLARLDNLLVTGSGVTKDGFSKLQLALPRLK